MCLEYPPLWELRGAAPNDVRRWYNFGALASIHKAQWKQGPSTKKSEALKVWSHAEEKGKAAGPTKKNEAPCTYSATNRTKQPTDQRISRKS
ncbi:hypothetical protein ACS0TY_035856 [Phlomoides rotata]